MSGVHEAAEGVRAHVEDAQRHSHTSLGIGRIGLRQDEDLPTEEVPVARQCDATDDTWEDRGFRNGDRAAVIPAHACSFDRSHVPALPALEACGEMRAGVQKDPRSTKGANSAHGSAAHLAKLKGMKSSE